MMYLIPDIFFLSCCFLSLGIGYMVKELRVRILYD